MGSNRSNKMNNIVALVALLLVNNYSASLVRSQDASTGKTQSVVVVHSTTTAIPSISSSATAIAHVDNHQNVSSTFLSPISSDEVKKFEAWKKSSLFVPSFEDRLLSIPDVQLEYQRMALARDLDFYREILREAIDKRNSFAPSMNLMWKYTTRLLTTLIKNRQTEIRISPRNEPPPSYFSNMADLVEQILDRSVELKRVKGYSKSSVDVDDYYGRTDALFKYIKRIVDASPVGIFLKWANNVRLFRGEPNERDLMEETSDLVAMTRAIGYEKTMFVARRIVNMLRLFSKGKIPSEKEV